MAATAPPMASIRSRYSQAPRLDLVGERLDEVGAGQRVDGVGHAGLVADHLLGPQRDLGRLGGRQAEGLVEAVGVQALGPARAPPPAPGR